MPTIMFLDVRMPTVDGIEVLRWMQTNLSENKPLLVVLSRIEELRHDDQAYALGANSFLAKPKQNATSTP
jgi:CheY-like chemotaxis protein